MMDSDRLTQQQRYAELLVKIGVNLQPGQSLRIVAELAHAAFTRLVTAVAYQAGARYVQVDWSDGPLLRNRLLYSQPEYLDFLPEFEVQRHREFVEDGWAHLSLTGPEFPDILDDVDPVTLRRVSQVRRQNLKFYSQAMMANQMQWCVAGVPTDAWAKKVFPQLPAGEATNKLWDIILHTVRADQPDPVRAWRRHDENLRKISRFMAEHHVTALHFQDLTSGPDAKPSTDLRIGLTDFPAWVAASSVTPAQVRFLPNMPTEEIFTTPHNQRVDGWVRTSKPAFPLQRRMEDAYFRFEQGEITAFHARVGQDALEQFFEIPGTRRLGEVALVDVRSPINQSGLLFFETLFDENAVSHIAFGEAYPEGVEGGASRTPQELAALGVNQADSHLDVMIGTASMRVTGLCSDGQTIVIMQDGQFTQSVLAG